MINNSLKYKKNLFISIVIGTSILSLFTSFTNLVPISAIISMFIVFLPFFLLGNNYVHPIFVSLSLLFLYFFFSVLLYSPEVLLNYDFYRRDGNFFITFAPLLVLSLLKSPINVNSIIKKFIVIITFLNFCFLLIFYLTGGTIFFFEAGIYHLLFEAHNAAGGFIAVLTALSFGYLVILKKPIYLIIFLVNLLSLFATDSRGSILALVIAIILVFFKKIRTPIITVVVLQIFLLSWFFINAPNDYMYRIGYYIENNPLDFLERSHTIINRGFYLWPRAINLFLQSPIFGAGFGSFNDVPYNLQGINYLFVYNIPINHNFDSGHSHHTFLQVLAETGMFGFILLISLLTVIYRFINRIEAESVSFSFKIVFWFQVISSFTEHRLFTPSQMLPFTILLGLAIASSRYKHYATKKYGEDLNSLM